MSIEMNIHWFPGHMTKARRMIEAQHRLVDLVCEIVDARIPESSRIPDLDDMIGDIPRMMILNRVDQADPNVTKAWAEIYRIAGMAVLETDSQSGKGTNAFAAAIRKQLADQIAKNRAKGLVGKPLRAMIVGIPNVGKSSFINRVARRRAAIASDRPGVTRGQQWVTVDKGIELLDTPGILWSRFDNQTIGENLAFTGAVRDEVLDRETLAANLLLRLRDSYPERIQERYKIQLDPQLGGYDLLEAVARRRGFLLSGNEVDLTRMAVVLLDEFRGGKLGRISLERPGAAIDN